MTTKLVVSGLIKRFGSTAVLAGLDLEVQAGDCILLTGANGAGKTTLLRILAGLTGIDAGSISLGGVVYGKRSDLPRRQIGFLTHQPILYESLTVLENLVFFGKLYGIGEAEKTARRLITKVGLALQAGKQAGKLSRGMQQRLSIARVLMHDPKILLMDEPYAGLDLEGAMMLGEILKECKDAGKIVLLTAHLLDQVGKNATRIGRLENGKVTFSMDAAVDAIHKIQKKSPRKQWGQR
jgi:heme exporter protein A